MWQIASMNVYDLNTVIQLDAAFDELSCFDGNIGRPRTFAAISVSS